MKKEELYSPEKIGTFQMMFGFPQPVIYRPNKWVSIRKTKEQKDENKR
jgi:hypothetical protein